MSIFSERFLEKAKTRRRRVGIGIRRPVPETIASLQRAAEVAEIVVVGPKVDGFESIVEADEDEASRKLISLLKDGKIDALVRGQVKDSFTLDEFHRQFGRVPLPSNRKVCPGIMEKGDYSFIVSTCSIYQGMTIEDKKFEIDRIIRYMEEDLGLVPKIGVMSTLRPTSKIGKYPLLDNMAKLNSELAAYLRGRGYDATEYYFEYETAVWNRANLIVPSMGLIGNAWMKALLYLGDWKLIACPYLDFGVAYEDGTRNEKDFYWHIVHAAAMANSR